MSLRLGLATDRSAYWGKDGLWTNTAMARLIAALRRRCDQLHVAISRSPRKLAGQDARLEAADVDYLPLPWYPNAAIGYFRNFSTWRTMRSLEKRCDVVIVQMPLPAVWGLMGARTPRVYNICANIYSAVEMSDGFRGLKRVAALSLARLIDRVQNHLVHVPDTAVVSHGREMLERYEVADGVSVVSSSLLPEEVGSVRRTRPADAPFRILYVGYLRHWKGVDVLFDAYEKVLSYLPNAELAVVGSKDLANEAPPEITHRCLRLAETGRVLMLGHVPFGPELLQHYADADVTVVPSRSGEGTPRVLVEARACGCPVIGTNVGGIPESIAHEVDGLLIPRNDSDALTSAIIRIAGNAEFRRQLIRGGLERAERTTVEHYADALVAEARRIAPKCPAPITNC